MFPDCLPVLNLCFCHRRLGRLGPRDANRQPPVPRGLLRREGAAVRSTEGRHGDGTHGRAGADVPLPGPIRVHRSVGSAGGDHGAGEIGGGCGATHAGAGVGGAVDAREHHHRRPQRAKRERHGRDVQQRHVRVVGAGRLQGTASSSRRRGRGGREGRWCGGRRVGKRRPHGGHRAEGGYAPGRRRERQRAAGGLRRRERRDRDIRAQEDAKVRGDVDARAHLLRAEHHEGAETLRVHASARELPGCREPLLSVRFRRRVRLDGRARGGCHCAEHSPAQKAVYAEDQDAQGDAGEHGDVLHSGHNERVRVPPRPPDRVQGPKTRERAARQRRDGQARRLWFRQEAGEGSAHVHVLRNSGVRGARGCAGARVRHQRGLVGSWGDDVRPADGPAAVFANRRG